MIILKFGGTSVANASAINQIASIIKSKLSNDKLVIVLSACSGITDQLLDLAQASIKNTEDYLIQFNRIVALHHTIIKELNLENDILLNDTITALFQDLKKQVDGCYLLKDLSPKTKDTILSFGELLSSNIVHSYLKKNIESNSEFIDSRNLIVTNNNFGNATVNFNESYKNITENFSGNNSKIVVLPGFIAKSSLGNTTTLGRGGSDYTASIVAHALEAHHIEIWTDVNGIFTTNPKIVKQAKSIPKISYQEAMELSYFGAKVLYAPTIKPAFEKNIPIWVKNTFEPENIGTLISNESENEKGSIIGISNIDKIALLTLEGSGMVGVSGVAKRMFEALSNQNINIIFITQSSSEHSICIGINENQAKAAKKLVDATFEIEINNGGITPSTIENENSIIAVVGDNMKNHQGISGKIFSTLGKNNINVRAIAQGASERNISIVIRTKDVNKALNILHETFFENITKQLNLFIVGVGNVGSKLLEQIQQQNQFLKENLNLSIRIIGISNSKKMIFNSEEGFDDHWKAELENGVQASIEKFIENITKLNLRNSILIDNTASEEIASHYTSCLKNNIAVVTCNKIACASSLENYKELKNLSKKYQTPFLYETNVGAGLPIIDTLKNCIASGDKVHKIQAVLSGTLNYLFNNYNEATLFKDIVKEAQNLGFTEPDPKIDLSGVDVMRKLLILIRESGYSFELDAIANENFLPQSTLETNSVDSLFENLIENENHFKKIFNEANEKNCRLKYVAEYNNGVAKVGLQHIPESHPFYHLDGKDNIVLFYTNRYKDQPLLIKGAGAGADVTASGLFADIIRVSNF